MSLEFVTDSQITLVSSIEQSGSSEPEAKKLRIGNTVVNDEENAHNAKKKKSRLFGKFRIRKSHKIDDHNGDLNKFSVKTRKIGTSVTPTSNGFPITRESFHPKMSVKSDEEEKHDLPSSFKSLFGKKENELNVNRSETAKLFYFGFLLPAMALHPESLKEVNFHFI